MEPSGTYLLLLTFGAAALLLWGTRMVRTGVSRAFGTGMRKILSTGRNNRLIAAGSGGLAAASLQSSTAVALFVASFARSGAVPVSLGLALLLGADVGSTVVAALLTLDIKQAWPLFIFAGYVLHSFYDGRSASGKQSGRIALGLGLILLALDSMGSLSVALSSSETVQLLLTSLGGDPLIAILIVAVLTWLAHSSIAILLFVASLADAGVLPGPELIVALVLGVNLGAPMPAIMLTLSEPAEARRIILGNGFFKLIGVTAGLLLLPWIAGIYNLLPGDAGFRTVLMHILFNLALAGIFLWFIHPAARLLKRFVRPSASVEEPFGPIYLSSSSAEGLPSVALSSLVRETLRMIDLVNEMLRQAFEMLETGDSNRSDEVHLTDDRVDTLYEAIKSYATDLTRQDLEEPESRRAVDILSYATSLENAGDVIDKSLVDIIEKQIRSHTSFSDEGKAEIRRLYDYVVETNRLAAAVTMNWEPDGAHQLLDRKRDFKRMVGDSAEQHLARLRRGEVRSVETSSYHLDIIGDLQRVNSLLAGIGYSVCGAQRSQREGAGPSR